MASSFGNMTIIDSLSNVPASHAYSTTLYFATDELRYQIYRSGSVWDSYLVEVDSITMNDNDVTLVFGADDFTFDTGNNSIAQLGGANKGDFTIASYFDPKHEFTADGVLTMHPEYASAWAEYFGHCEVANDWDAFKILNPAATPEGFLLSTDGKALAALLPFMKVQAVGFMVTRVKEMANNSYNLFPGYPGQIVEWVGADYGVALPDNLWPCDGSTIINTKSDFHAQASKNFKNKVLAGAGTAGAAGTTAGTGSRTLSTSNLPTNTFSATGSYCYPNVSVSVGNYSGSRDTDARQTDIFSGLGYNNYSNKYVLPYTVTSGGAYMDYYEAGGISDMTSTNWDNVTINGSATHFHDVDITHGHTATVTSSYTSISNGSVVLNSGTLTAIDMRQETAYVERYLVIY